MINYHRAHREGPQIDFCNYRLVSLVLVVKENGRFERAVLMLKAVDEFPHQPK